MVSWSSFPGDAGLEAEQKLLDMRIKFYQVIPSMKR